MMTKAKTEIKTDPTDVQEGAAAAPEEGIGDRIRAARESRGLSQTALSARTKVVDSTGKGVARTVLVGYEAGTFRPGAREMRLLCQALSVSPNWLLLGADGTTTQASMEAVRRRDWATAVRLAMAIAVLKEHERASLQSLVLSLAGRQLGDLKLSSLLTVGSMIAQSSLPDLVEWFGDDVEGATLETLMHRVSEGMVTNLGNKLQLNDEGDVIGGEWLYRDPGKVT
jgi:transcriptional regulator with XRE-family HTH domain